MFSIAPNNLKSHQPVTPLSSSVWFGTIDHFFSERDQKHINTLLYFLLLIEDSQTSIQIDGQEFMLQKGDLIIITPFNIRTTIPSENGIKGYVIGYSESFYVTTPEYCNFFFDTLAVLNNPVYSSEKSSEADVHFIENTFKQAWNLFKEQDPDQNSINSRIIRVLISTTFLFMQKRKRLQKNTTVLEHYESKYLVIHFIQLLNEHFREQSSIKFYLNKLEVSELILNNQCKKILGIPPKEIMQQKIIAEAKRLLLQSEKNIQEIAYYLGYTDPSNFNKFFLKRLGVTPRQFRQQFLFLK